MRRKIVLMNVGTEHRLERHLGAAHSLAKSVWRHAWFASEGDVLVTPMGLDDEWLAYVGEVLGWDARSVAVVTRDELVTDDVLASSDVVDALRWRIAAGGTWSLLPCFATAGVAQLAAALELDPRGAFAFAAQDGGDLFNRKSHFRQLAAGGGLPLADGALARSPRDLAAAIAKYLPRTGTVILKQDDAAGGMGNVAITRGDLTPRPGTRETLSAADDLASQAVALWEALTDAKSQVVVVESYHDASHRFYFEFAIDEAGAVRFVSGGTIRVRADADPYAKELVWVGLDLPAELPAFSGADALSKSVQCASLAGRVGYRGHLNVDAIVTDSGDVLLNEANARWGGGLVLDAIATRLVGPRWGDGHVLSSLRDVASPRLADALRVLRKRGLHFSREKGEGTLVLACDRDAPGTAEHLVIAKTRARAREFEASLRDALQR